MATPHLIVRMVVTMQTSKSVGSTLNTVADRMKLMPRVPRSMTRLRAPEAQEGVGLGLEFRV